MKLLPIISGALAAVTLFSPINSYLRRETAKPAEKPEETTEIFEEARAAFDEYLPGVVCWGDSLTVGAGGDGVTYPNVLSSLIEEDLGVAVDVVNMGVGGETSATIVARSGAEPFRAQAFTIPADCTPVRVKIYSEIGKTVFPLIQGDGAVNPVVINGIRGTLSSTKESVIERTQYFFTRETAGEETDVPRGTEIITHASTMWKDYINVVFMGTNGNFSSVNELIEQHKTLLSRSERNGERYIVVGLYTLNTYQVTKQYGESFYDELEAAMTEEFGDRYIDLHGYLLTDGLADAGLEPTEDDLAAIGEGRVPPSLMVDDMLHLNAAGYELLGKLLYVRMDALGYFDEVRSALAK